MSIQITEGTREYKEYFEEYRVEKTPFDRPKSNVVWDVNSNGMSKAKIDSDAIRIDLNGTWDLVMAEHLSKGNSLYSLDEIDWHDSVAIEIPCTIQSALFDKGKIEDPLVMKNNLDIEWIAGSFWCLKKTFKIPLEYEGKNIQLFFQGVDYKCNVWLNGSMLGSHTGMFGGPEYDISNIINYDALENELIIIIEPSPELDQHPVCGGITSTFKAGFGFGWHYVKLLTMGIWQSVYLNVRGDVMFHTPPFLNTTRIENDTASIELSIDIMNKTEKTKNAIVHLEFVPNNFLGKMFRTNIELTLKPGINEFCFTSSLEDIQLWWPFTMGNPNLYMFDCKLEADNKISDEYTTNIGLRTIEMVYSSAGEDSFLYKWQFVINGRKHWVKGSNWCSPDSLLRLDRNRYLRYFELARNANIDLLRAWGLGIIETDEFYNLCDEMGIMVWQEFPIGGAHDLDDVPTSLAEDMCSYVVPRLRNRASLVIWCGANEMYLIPEVNREGKMLQYIGKRCYELDGTRYYRKTCPYGGDVHTYKVFWDNHDIMDYKKTVDDIHFGFVPHAEGFEGGPVAVTEWGLSSPANYETWEKIMPVDELNTWPLKRDGVFVHHTPTFEARHIDIMTRYAIEIKPVECLKDLITGMQISQGIGFKYMIEQMRARKPYTTTTIFYKLTENYPGCSWAVVDYYGSVKRSYYFAKDAYKPVHIMALYDKWSYDNNLLNIDVYGVNDSSEDISCIAQCNIYNEKLVCIEKCSFEATISVDKSVKLKEIICNSQIIGEGVFFLVLDLIKDEKVIDRNWYFFNFESNTEKLWCLDKVELDISIKQESDNYVLSITNVDSLPAAGLYMELGKASGSFYIEDNNLWLQPGETRHIKINETIPVDGKQYKLETVMVSAYNTIEYLIAL